MNGRFFPAGDSALVVELGDEIRPDVNARVRALEYLIAQSAPPAVVETVPSFRSLLVYYDPLLSGYDALCASIAQLLPRAGAAILPHARNVELPCCYEDPELGFELAAAADYLGMSPAQLVSLHSEAQYDVYFIGFAPGQPYMMGTANRLTIPRLTTPRATTPAGSVGIGGAQCCVYSVQSPGGFWVLGRTPLRLYDPRLDRPILLRPGDRVRFRPIDRCEYDRVLALVAAQDFQPEIT